MIKAFFDGDYPDPCRIEENGQAVGTDAMEKMALVVSGAEEAIKRSKNMWTCDLLTSCG